MTEASLVNLHQQPQAAYMAGSIKRSRGYTRRVTVRAQAQTLWMSLCLMSGVVAQALINTLT